MTTTTLASEAAMMHRRFRSPLHPRERLPHDAANDAPPGGEPLVLDDGRTLTLRPIHAADVDALQRGFSHLSADEVRLRFLHVMRELPAPLAERLCRIDHEHEVAFVLVDDDAAGENEIRGVARAFLDPVTATAEYALIVQKAYTGQGLGHRLMQHLIDACRDRGALEVWGDVLAENHAMLRLCDELGFGRQPVFHDAGVVRVTLAL